MSETIWNKRGIVIQKRPAYVLSIFIIGISLAITVPPLFGSFAPTGDTLDTSWAWMLGYGAQHSMPWGKSLIFTYGPLGFLANPFFYSDHSLWMLSAITRALTWFGFGLFYAISASEPRRIESTPTINMVLGLIAWIIGAALVDVATQATLIALMLLAYALKHAESKSPISALVLAGALLAFGALIKSTALIVASFTLIAYPALYSYVHNSRKRLLAGFTPLLSFVVFFAVLYIASGQNLANLVAYLRGTVAIAGGYTPAMSIHGEPAQTISALIVLALFLVTGIRHLANRNRLAVAQLLIFGLLLFWAWKEGFTRHDPGVGGHAMIFYGVTLLVSGVMLPTLAVSQNRIGYTSVVWAYAIALIFAVRGMGVPNGNELPNYKRFVDLMTSRAARESLQASQDRALKAQFHLAPAALCATSGATVNVIPWDLMMAQGYGFKLLPSPVIQAYSVYTPYLDHVNANQIWNGSAAQRIVYSFESIDGRYPVFDEPATFRAMQTCYHTSYAGWRYSVLDRNQCIKPKLLSIKTISEQPFGSWIGVPTSADYMDIHVRTTIFGRLANVFYKTNQVHILFRLANGSIVGPYRFIYAVGGDGLFVKYFISSQEDANKVFASDAAGLQRIVAVKLTTARHSLDYADQFESRFFYTIPPRAWAIRRLPQPLLQPPALLIAKIARNNQSRKAWRALSGIYFERPDLQKAFPMGSVDFYQNLLRWASFTTASSDSDYPILQPWQADYKAMLARIK